MKKLAYVIGAIADYAFGAITIAVGLGIIIGGTTGLLWL